MNITPLILFVSAFLLIGDTEAFWSRRRRSVQQRPRGPRTQRGGPPPQGCPQLGPPPPGYQQGVPQPPRGPPPPGYRPGPPRGTRGPRPAGPIRPRRRGDEELSDVEQLKQLLLATNNKDFDVVDNEILNQILDQLQE